MIPIYRRQSFDEYAEPHFVPQNWYERLAWWIVKRSTYPVRVKTLKAMCVEIHERTLLQTIKTQVMEAMKYGPAPRDVLVGYDVIRDLTGELDPYVGYLAIDTRGIIQGLIGINITVIPWVKGIVVLPGTVMDGLRSSDNRQSQGVHAEKDRSAAAPRRSSG